MADSTSRQFPLPDVDSNGYESQVHLSSDGTVWVSEPYTLINIDPKSGSERRLDLGAPDPANLTAPDQGTWIGSFLVDESNLYVARANDPSLYVFDVTSLSLKNQWQLPAAVAGATALAKQPDGNLLVDTGDPGRYGVFELSSSGQLIGELAQTASRVAVTASGDVIASGQLSAAASAFGSAPAATNSPPAVPVYTPYALSVPDPLGGYVAYTPSTGRLAHWLGGVERSAVLTPITPTTTEDMGGVPGAGSGTSFARLLPAAMAVDSAGAVWVAPSGLAELLKFDLPG